MPQINILNILQGDNQTTIVDKVNYNFDQILSAGGGPQGQQGLIGPTGPIGPQGPQGTQGLQGPSGTKWFVQDASPASGAVTGSNPWTYPTIGDYWLDPDSANQDIYVFTATGWTYTGYGLAAGDIFQKVVPVNFQGSATGSAILIAGTGATSTGVVLSDASINDYTPGGSAIDNVNYENAKLKLSTRDDRTKIISFGRSTFDISLSGSGSTGSNRNPSFDWDASTSGGNYYDIALNNPGGVIGIRSNAPAASGGVNIQANGEVTANSSNSYISLKTSSINQGVFNDVSNNGGFLEVSNQSLPSPINQTNPFLYVNSTGVGIGVGTGGFKYTGNDARKLSVLGNVTIGTSASYHTQSLFSGYPGSGKDSGFLYVQGHAGFGPATGPTAFPGGASITGPAESQNVFPQVFITASEAGPALSVAAVVGPSRVGRTVIGNGNYDFAAGNTIASSGVDLTQEYFFGGGKGSTFPGGPMFSFQQKITDPTNTASTAPVFGITTYGSIGSYNNNVAATGTIIQTLNSNNRLLIQSNSTSPTGTGNNLVAVGTNGYTKLGVWGGLSSDQYGTVSIGKDSDNISGMRIPLIQDYQTTILSPSVPTKGTYYQNYQTDDHSLYLLGYQTIGAPDTISMFASTIAPSGRPYGYNTKLKIHRNLGSYTNLSKGSEEVRGSYPGDYSNGLEITSLISQDPGGGKPSFAIAVGAMSTISYLNERTSANTTGFMVSDTGENVSIGTSIDSDYSLSVHKSSGVLSTVSINGTGGTGGAIKASGALEVLLPYNGTNSTDIAANIGMTGPSAKQLLVLPNATPGAYNGNTVAGDLSLISSNGTTTNNSMTIGAHSAGGLRFYRSSGGQDVVSNVGVQRVDTDITTGTDTPGWVYYGIPQYGMVQQYQAAWTTLSHDYNNANLWSRSHLRYKIIGKTAYIQYMINIITGAGGPNSGSVQILLPPPLQNILNYYIPVPSGASDPGLRAGAGDSAGWFISSSTNPVDPRGRGVTAQSLRYYTTTTSTNASYINNWVIVIDRMDGQYITTGPGYGYFRFGNTLTARGQLMTELN